jgi:multidrug efflux pump subunit AcrA (membrane-fusion protein)
MNKVVIFAVTAIAAAGLVVVPSLLADNNTAGGGRGAGASTEAAAFSVRVEEAEKRDLQAYIEINGNVVSEQQVAVVPDAAGKLVSLRVELGSTVRRGDIIAEVDPSRPGSNYSLSPVYAPISGVITTTPLPVGSTVSASTSVAVISVMDNLVVEVMIPEREVGQLRVGLKAGINFQAFPGETFAATVSSVSPVLDPASRTKKISLRFDRQDRRINTGMFAQVRLNTRSYDDVITIPVEAVVNSRGKIYVYILEGPEQVFLREVETGAAVDDLIEIKSGLQEGDAVVIQGQQFLTDGAQVRVIGQRKRA